MDMDITFQVPYSPEASPPLPIFKRPEPVKNVIHAPKLKKERAKGKGKKYSSFSKLGLGKTVPINPAIVWSHRIHERKGAKVNRNEDDGVPSITIRGGEEDSEYVESEVDEDDGDCYVSVIWVMTEFVIQVLTMTMSQQQPNNLESGEEQVLH
jgi:hypothetical protein